MTSMRIEVICTGDEVLTGKIVNTNFSYITQKLEDFGLSVRWDTTVGDDRESLLPAFQLAARPRRRGDRQWRARPDGGRSVAGDRGEGGRRRAGAERGMARARWRASSRAAAASCRPTTASRRCCPPTAEVLDNPIGTACGFAVDIGKARFFFTPGVPRELRRMLEEQIIPRLLARSGTQTAIHLKRFHSYGIGESHADTLLAGRRGPRARRQRQARLPRALPAARDQAHGARRRHGRHRPQARAGAGGGAQAARQLHPRRGRPDARRRRARRAGQPGGTLALVETFTSGQIAARIAPLPGAENVFRRGIVARDLGEICAAVGLAGGSRRGRSRARRRRRSRAPRGSKPAPRMRWRC